MTLTCPRCASALESAPHATGMAWRCPACQGQSLNFSQFRRLIPELQANEIWLTVMENPVPPQRHARCPECRTDMAAVLIPFHRREIELDICLTCQRLWMDSPEREARRLTLDEPASGPKPPVVAMKGRGVKRPARETGPRLHGGSAPDHPSFPVYWLRVLIKRLEAILPDWFRQNP